MVQLRKKVLVKEVVTTDQLGQPCTPVVRVAVMAVFQNPLAGKFSEDLSAAFSRLKQSLIWLVIPSRMGRL